MDCWFLVHDLFLSPVGISVSNVRINMTSLLAELDQNITGLLQDSVHHLPKPQKGRYLLVQYSHMQPMDIFGIRIAELIVHTKGEQLKTSNQHAHAQRWPAVQRERGNAQTSLASSMSHAATGNVAIRRILK